jgi:hypothetical protein
MSIGSNGTFHRTLTIAALCAAIAAPLAAAATPSGSGGASSGGGSGHVSSGSFGGARAPGAGTLMRPSGGDPSMRQPAWNLPASSDRKRLRYRRNYDWTWFNRQAPCNTAMWLQPALAMNVYGPVTASCWWQNPPLWLP